MKVKIKCKNKERIASLIYRRPITKHNNTPFLSPSSAILFSLSSKFVYERRSTHHKEYYKGYHKEYHRIIRAMPLRIPMQYHICSFTMTHFLSRSNGYIDHHHYYERTIHHPSTFSPRITLAASTLTSSTSFTKQSATSTTRTITAIKRSTNIRSGNV